jgi:hypothetical protein
MLRREQEEEEKGRGGLYGMGRIRREDDWEGEEECGKNRRV